MEIHEIPDVSVGSVFLGLRSIDETLGELQAKLDVVRTAAPLPVLARVDAHVRQIAGAVSEIPPGASHSDGVDDACRCHGVNKRRLACAFVQHFAKDGAVACVGCAVPPLKTKLEMAFEDSSSGAHADAQDLLRELLTHFDLLVHQTWNFGTMLFK